MDEPDKNVVAYCGLNCAECFSYKRTVSEAAKSLRRELRAAKLKDAWKDIPFLDEYETFKKSLDGLAKLRCIKMCRSGGGNPWCPIRKCSQKKQFAGCWECTEAEICGKLKPRYLTNVEVIKRVGIDGFLMGKKK